MSIKLYECRCIPNPCSHMGLFVDNDGNDMPGLARYLEIAEEVGYKFMVATLKAHDTPTHTGRVSDVRKW